LPIEDAKNQSAFSISEVSVAGSSPFGEVGRGPGLKFLRFHDEEAKKDMEVVIRKIEEYINCC
jgi:hypothetical protein